MSWQVQNITLIKMIRGGGRWPEEGMKDEWKEEIKVGGKGKKNGTEKRRTGKMEGRMGG